MKAEKLIEKIKKISLKDENPIGKLLDCCHVPYSGKIPWNTETKRCVAEAIHYKAEELGATDFTSIRQSLINLSTHCNR